IVIEIDVNVSTDIDVALDALSHHQHGSRLAAARIASGCVARLESGVEPFRQLSLRRFERLAHGFWYLRPNQDVSLRGPCLALAIAGPMRRIRSCIGSDISFGIDNGH